MRDYTNYDYFLREQRNQLRSMSFVRLSKLNWLIDTLSEEPKYNVVLYNLEPVLIQI